jgi:hypothetical protein
MQDTIRKATQTELPALVLQDVLGKRHFDRAK